MRFFTVDLKKGEVLPSGEILQIHPFNVIWAREDKEKAIKEISYIAFMENLEDDNPFRDTPEEIREATVIDALFGEEKYLPDSVVLHARSVLKERYQDTHSYRYYLAALDAGEALRSYMETVNFDERTKSGGMVHDPNKTRTTIEETIKTLNKLKELKARVITEAFETSSQIKNRGTGMFED